MLVRGDVRVASPGLALSLDAEKAVMPALDIHLALRVGQARGQDYTPSTNFLPNPALNQQRDSVLYYTEGMPVIHNYRMRSASAMVTFQCNLNQLFWDQRQWDVILTGGFGGFAFRTHINAIDEQAQQIYDYGPTAMIRDQAAIKKSLNQLLDDTYETQAERDRVNETMIGEATLELAFQVGAGLTYHWNDRWASSLVLGYLATGSDLIDGQQWRSNSQTTPTNDRLVSFGMRVMRRL
jgi:hypothetical protein